MQCHHYDAGRCRSCTLLDLTHPQQVRGKEAHVRGLLALPDDVWLAPVVGDEAGFRNKAKMVVTGTAAAPVLGILGPPGEYEGQGVDLTDCPLYPAELQAAFEPLAELIRRARLTPYDLTPTFGPGGRRRKVTPKDAAQRGELKHVIVTLSPAGELMVRLVLRSTEPVARLRKHLPWLAGALPALAVLSVNVQPAHAAVLEGAEEIVLTERQTLGMELDGITLHLRPQSFFQTNTEVATALYRQARAWVDEVSPAALWDLYCGVGGFALHCAAPGRAVTGIEISAEAVASATTTARELATLPPDAVVGGHDAAWWRAATADVEFAAGDAATFALGTDADPDMVIVNPPRRGIGTDLAGRLEASGVRHVLYSSCNAATLARDLADMPSLRPTRARLLDMFPHTDHYEVLVLLERAA
ncbi:23S rRNA (uracil(747)-C(5))-methyltransferase RlmC [Isoptericola dokdonensis]|uniref:23S rRNA (Uracil(747)-C(5))-methyltransferase RlmC n=1 Tax=Isoptericola dokdonensis DS-3 TaxID=1300344 RepID=A0A161I2Y9_9MICO|nr:23S rRNA (uracil(747)-C(5))-methyltransferase RlmC [Isoptericola dokdonensis]ANC32185.1 23S rRNA (uracil(747)-C(5))-methyltransferase RlmC [Isoptericola dokdonensis DS-3]